MLNHLLAIVYFLRNTRSHDAITVILIIHPLYPFPNISHEIFNLLFSSSYYVLCRLFNAHWLIANIILLFIIFHILLLHSLSSWSSFLSHWFIITSTIKSHYIIFYFILIKDLFSLSFILIIISILFYCIPLLWEFGNCDNNILADPLSTLIHINPEWYFLLFYSLLRSYPSMILGLIFLLYFLLLILLLGIRNLSSLSYSISNIDYYYLSYAGLILYNWFRAYWTLGLSLLYILLLFPLSSLATTYYFISIQRLFILAIIILI